MIRNLSKIMELLSARQEPDWFNGLRINSLSRFNELGIPTVKDEDWKYTNLLPLANSNFEITNDVKCSDSAPLQSYCQSDEVNIVFVNGTLSEELSNINHFPGGISFSTIFAAISNDDPEIHALLTKYNIHDTSAFAALNQAASSDGIFLRINAQTKIKKLIHIIHMTDASHKNAASMPRALISLGESSEATVLESYICYSDKTAYFANALTDIFLKKHASLHYCSAQKESLKAFHIGHVRVWQERDSNFDGFTLTAGGKLARNNLDITLNGEGANVSLNALYSAYNDQHVDHHTSVDHRVPNCTSKQMYKGILNHTARAVFNGKMFVRSEAQKTNSYQLNKNLLFGKDCRVDTKPQLEIFADDVKCTHGASVGQLDEDEMFYLQTRCIPRAQATKMLAHGFVDDLFSTIENKSIRTKLNKLMEPSFKALE
jgi:Fe-S cluster assembly protein SufD